MANLTIRNLDDNAKKDSAPARCTAWPLNGGGGAADARARGAGGLAERIGRRFALLDAENLPIPARRPSRPAPQTDDA